MDVRLLLFCCFIQALVCLNLKNVLDEKCFQWTKTLLSHPSEFDRSDGGSILQKESEYESGNFQKVYRIVNSQEHNKDDIYFLKQLCSKDHLVFRRNPVDSDNENSTSALTTTTPQMSLPFSPSSSDMLTQLHPSPSQGMLGPTSLTKPSASVPLIASQESSKAFATSKVQSLSLSKMLSQSTESVKSTFDVTTKNIQTSINVVPESSSYYLENTMSTTGVIPNGTIDVNPTSSDYMSMSMSHAMSSGASSEYLHTSNIASPLGITSTAIDISASLYMSAQSSSVEVSTMSNSIELSAIPSSLDVSSTRDSVKLSTMPSLVDVSSARDSIEVSAMPSSIDLASVLDSMEASLMSTSIGMPSVRSSMDLSAMSSSGYLPIDKSKSSLHKTVSSKVGQSSSYSSDSMQLSSTVHVPIKSSIYTSVDIVMTQSTVYNSQTETLIILPSLSTTFSSSVSASITYVVEAVLNGDCNVAKINEQEFLTEFKKFIKTLLKGQVKITFPKDPIKCGSVIVTCHLKSDLSSSVIHRNLTNSVGSGNNISISNGTFSPKSFSNVKVLVPSTSTTSPSKTQLSMASVAPTPVSTTKQPTTTPKEDKEKNLVVLYSTIFSILGFVLIIIIVVVIVGCRRSETSGSFKMPGAKDYELGSFPSLPPAQASNMYGTEPTLTNAAETNGDIDKTEYEIGNNLPSWEFPPLEVDPIKEKFIKDNDDDGIVKEVHDNPALDTDDK